mmetsp:Transcript_8213/g.11419  ORF Transcript_8213/g.11419 Transcript_8213/m.11419 type:complete len:106 (-) Transcript_8213:2939-3256(-)
MMETEWRLMSYKSMADEKDRTTFCPGVAGETITTTIINNILVWYTYIIQTTKTLPTNQSPYPKSPSPAASSSSLPQLFGEEEEEASGRRRQRPAAQTKSSRWVRR